MKHLYSFLLVFLISLFLASPVEAKVILQEKGAVTVAAGEVINDDLFIGAESADIAGTVNGDVYVGAGTVNFSGKVKGDIIVGAGTVNITKATIGDSIIVGAGTVTIDDQSKIGGSLIAGVGTLNNSAPVGRNLMVGAGNIVANGMVGGEARIGAESLTLGPKTVINGDLTYTTEKDLTQADTAVVKGEITRHQVPQSKPVDRQTAQKAWKTAKLGLEGFSFLGAFLVGLVMIWLTPSFSLGVAGKIQNKFLSSLGWGLVVLAVAPFGLFLLALTGIGLPLAFILGLLFIIDLYLTKIFASLALGKVLAQRFGWKFSQPLVYFIGLVAYYLLRLVPVVGALVRLAALLAGLGGFWIYKKQLLAKNK